MGRYSTTVQFPHKSDYQRLKVLATVQNETVGECIQRLVDSEKKRVEETHGRQLAKELRGDRTTTAET